MRTLLTTFLLLLTLHLPAQDFLEDLSRDLCNCVNERGYTKDDDSCYNETVDNYKEEIEGFYGDLENKTNSNMLNADMIFYFAKSNRTKTVP